MYQSPLKIWYSAAAIIGYIILLSLPIFACVKFLQQIPASPYTFTTPLESQTITVESLPLESYIRIGGGRVQTVAYAPDGKHLAVGTTSSLRLYNTSDYEIEQLLPTQNSVGNIIWSPDSTLLLASIGSEVVVYDASTGQPLRSLQHTQDAIVGEPGEIAWSPDGKYVASVALLLYHAEAWIWEVASGERVFTLENDATFPYAEGVSWSPDGKYLAVSYRYSSSLTARARTDEIYLWEINTSPRVTTQWSLPAAGNINWSLDGQSLLMSSYNAFYLIDPASGAILKQMPLGGIDSFELSSQGDQVAVGAGRDSVVIYTIPDLKERQRLNGLWDGAESISWSPSGDTVAASSTFVDGFFVWSVADGMLLHHVELQSHWFESISWSPDNQTVIVGGRDNRVYLYSAVTGEQVAVWGEQDPGGTTYVDWSFDGRWVAWASQKPMDGVGEIWSAEGDFITRIPGTFAGDLLNTPLAWSPVTNQLAIAVPGKLQLWEMTTDGQLVLLQETVVTGIITSLAWAPDGKRLVTGLNVYVEADSNHSGSITIWQTSPFTITQQIHVEAMEYIRGVAWALDNDLVGVSYDTPCPTRGCAQLEVWSTVTGELVRSFGNQEFGASSLVWSPDGQWLLANSSIHFSEATLYPMQDNRHIYAIDAHHGRVEVVAWSPDGHFIASAGNDGHIFILKVSTLPIHGELE